MNHYEVCRRLAVLGGYSEIFGMPNERERISGGWVLVKALGREPVPHARAIEIVQELDLATGSEEANGFLEGITRGAYHFSPESFCDIIYNVLTCGHEPTEFRVQRIDRPNGVFYQVHLEQPSLED